MRKPATADERERRTIEYLSSVHQGRLKEFKLGRMNRIANFRKQLKQLLDEIIESRAEELAASMLLLYAPPRPAIQEGDAVEERLIISPHRGRTPVWVKKAGDRRFRRAV